MKVYLTPEGKLELWRRSRWHLFKWVIEFARYGKYIVRTYKQLDPEEMGRVLLGDL